MGGYSRLFPDSTLSCSYSKIVYSQIVSMFPDSDKQKPQSTKRTSRTRNPSGLWDIGLILGVVALIWLIQNERGGLKTTKNTALTDNLPPLALSSGNPYIRALMRTISASEANDRNSYALLYGGSHVHDLSQHPDRCLPIKTQPNRGKCSSAAGRYQFLTSTWLEKAAKYHPAPSRKNGHTNYSFEPKYQDIVVYQWLKDRRQWDVDILGLLKKDRVEEVLTSLSGVWTSLGGGIEDNSMTPHLPSLYREFLAEELKTTPQSLPK